ncbi:WecB/TagA/CpsF family glycosyltransferase [Sphingomonas sp. CBMAI 2297]|uniref:WecB/TagA/CpsF family glycosyltransferase n=1 Tax=Sphingomonas sp. CBMAI 2297 TaxID=2991720 RepID=UPI002458704E|nr:WecB/TagA/CpsF family glycosyltransferase [Sphingomonas sp. CBMAI 2297]MDH4746635.1 WecB/TagA/CpsF family glycosyltransferase [Sphingomonas sp. CBMAI 2297]
MYRFQDLNSADIEPRAISVEKSRLFGLDLARSDQAQMADLIAQRARMGHAMVVNFVNAHCVNVATTDPVYRECLESSELLLPDGSGMKLAARIAGVPTGENLNGTDLFPLLCERAARFGLSIYLLGAGPGLASRTAQAMQARYPELKVAGTHDGFFDAAEEEALLREIEDLRPDLLFVAMGVPLQEKWIHRHRARLGATVTLGVGGLFDYYSGRLPRAPLPVRRLGFEWMWRLALEPRRLAQRYVRGNFAFLIRACAYGIARRTAPRKLPNPKRCFDLALGAALLLAAAPIMLLAALAIRLESQGPVFFRQLRIGRDGRPFRIWKFRSMVVDAEQRRRALLAFSERDATCFKMRRDPRVTRVGRAIRRWSVDELPQIFNVLSGDMSLVGPRPALPEEVTRYGEHELGRLRGRPGITCTWQVSGRAEIAFAQQVEMDIAYLRDISLRGDLLLLARTLPAVLSARGAY